MPKNKLRIFKIARLRHRYDGTERWVDIGSCGVNEDGTGFIELNANNETWRLFLRDSKKDGDDNQ